MRSEPEQTSNETVLEVLGPVRAVVLGGAREWGGVGWGAELFIVFVVSLPWGSLARHPWFTMGAVAVQLEREND